MCWQPNLLKLLSIFWSSFRSLLVLFWYEENVLTASIPSYILYSIFIWFCKLYFSNTNRCISKILVQNVLTTVLALGWPRGPDLPGLRHLHPSSFHTASGQHQYFSYYHMTYVFTYLLLTIVQFSWLVVFAQIIVIRPECWKTLGLLLSWVGQPVSDNDPTSTAKTFYHYMFLNQIIFLNWSQISFWNLWKLANKVLQIDEQIERVQISTEKYNPFFCISEITESKQLSVVIHEVGVIGMQWSIWLYP